MVNLSLDVRLLTIHIAVPQGGLDDPYPAK